jgi:hypothetical protein
MCVNSRPALTNDRGGPALTRATSEPFEHPFSLCLNGAMGDDR